MTDIAVSEGRRLNHRYLITALAGVREDLERYGDRFDGGGGSSASAGDVGEELARIAGEMRDEPALEALVRMFGLSRFERNLLLLCVGRDIDMDFDRLLAVAQRNANAAYPTLRLALDLWPDGSMQALVAGAPLCRWGLVEIDPGPTAATRPLRAGERILHYLDGADVLDEVLHAILRPLGAPVVPPGTSGSLDALSDRLAEVLVHAEEHGSRLAIQLCGEEYSIKQAAAAASAAELRSRLYMLAASNIPFAPIEQERLARLWDLERRLSRGILLVDCHGADSADAMRSAMSFIERVDGPAIVAVRDPVRSWRGMVRIDAQRPPVEEQLTLWHGALGNRAGALAPAIESVVGHFSLGVQDIYTIGTQVVARLESDPLADGALALWRACRVSARPRLEGLAELILPNATWDDLILPETQYQTIRELTAHVRQRMKVYHRWGLAARGNRGLGTSALFSGPSGTGKTLSAEVIAAELQLDLYHIDLSQVVSKYIGETEKNLRRIFDTAEEAGAVLLFDEADALFGKRSEVKDSHDRHANIEVSYLLQRMERYRGLAILTTNMKSALDTAFMRRIRFVVNFPFPDAAQRKAIWQRIYPDTLPTAGLEFDKLSRLNVAGGNIRNIALNAAFLAADEDEPVQMRHMLRAARGEYVKLEKPLTEIEIKEWVQSPNLSLK